MRNLLLLCLTCALLPTWAASQTIENVRFWQTEDDMIVVTYDIVGGEGMTFEVSLHLSDDGGVNYPITPRTVSGDVGSNVRGGRGKRIVWDVLMDMRRLQGENFVFMVRAKVKGGLNIAGIEFVFVPGGTFEMGDLLGEGESDEKPVHRVTVSGFYMSKTEVTVAQFRRFVEATGYRTEAEREGYAWTYTAHGWKETPGVSWRSPGFQQGDDHPVVYVSWNDAVAFCRWAGCRLPTEAEWEYAARSGGKKVRYSWGNEAPSGRIGGNVADESVKRQLSGWPILEGYEDGYVYTAPVGSFAPNALGLYDMSGNVWEWCADWYDENYYRQSPQQNPRGPSSGGSRVTRGGSWGNQPWSCRCANRAGCTPAYRLTGIGFRVVRAGP